MIWSWNNVNASGGKSEDSDKTETSYTEMLSDNESVTTISGDEDEAIMTHTVTFKCIGASKNADAQQALKKVSEKLRLHQHVSVDIFPEPDNPILGQLLSRFLLITTGIQLGMWYVKL